MSDAETVNSQRLQNELVDKLIEQKSLTDKTVEAAFRAIPRHFFLPDIPLEKVYKDNAIPTKKDEHGRAISSSSQPAMMAIMLEQLDIQPGENVLEVGAGTGYNAALMGYLVGEHGRITTIDIDQDIVDAAQIHLEQAVCPNVNVICGDGMDGYAAHAPYDRIILTVGGWDIAPAWLEQLKPDGRLLLPLSLKGPQYAIAFDRQNGYLTSRSVRGCGFMRLRGPNAGSNQSILIDPEGNIEIDFEDNLDVPRRINKKEIYDSLANHYEDQATGIHLSVNQVWRSLLIWLAIHEPNLVFFTVRGEMTRHEASAFLFGRDGESPWRVTIGVLDDDGLAVYVRLATQQTTSDDDSQQFELGIRNYGAADTAVQKLKAHAQNWQASGYPIAEEMKVEVYPIKQANPSATAVHGRWHTFVITFPKAEKKS